MYCDDFAFPLAESAHPHKVGLHTQFGGIRGYERSASTDLPVHEGYAYVYWTMSNSLASPE